MPTPIVLPKQGQSVESCLIVEWKISPGDEVAVGDVVCEIETDKAVMEIESPAAGTLLATFFAAGDVAPVQVNIAAIGAPGDDVGHLRPESATDSSRSLERAAGADDAPPTVAEQAESEQAESDQERMNKVSPPIQVGSASLASSSTRHHLAVSPRARRLADQHGIDVTTLTGSGPGGRIIERDIPLPDGAQTKPARPERSSVPAFPTEATEQVSEDETATRRVSPVAKAMLDEGTYAAPAEGSGPRGRVMARDLQPLDASPSQAESPQEVPAIGKAPVTGATTARPLQGVRKRIAQRMRESLQQSAQLTLNRTADARSLQRLRSLFKAADPATGLPAITLNDLLLYAVAQTLPAFPALNARLEDETIHESSAVHLGFAVDTPRGLLVPVLFNAQRMGLLGIAQTTRRLGARAVEGKLGPDEMAGGTFTVTNLGSLEIESFTPILNPPQVGILGVGAIHLRPVTSTAATAATAGNDPAQVTFVPHIHLSLTIDHAVVDGAPGARFLQALAQRLATLEEELVRTAAMLAAQPSSQSDR